MNGRPLDALLLTTNTFRIADWINLIKSHTKAESYHGTFLQSTDAFDYKKETEPHKIKFVYCYKNEWGRVCASFL